MPRNLCTVDLENFLADLKDHNFDIVQMINFFKFGINYLPKKITHGRNM